MRIGDTLDAFPQNRDALLRRTRRYEAKIVLIIMKLSEIGESNNQRTLKRNNLAN